ncbi:unnamed protein product [Somion occarium]|uniref:PNPLA domain-containing protein n=1 Tax=Somion occarium TaxID=3059160 RepID=A0ABP1CQN1_9APHY
MADPSEKNQCKVNPEVNYDYSDYHIWQAARATSAAPTYFKRIKIGTQEYIDGGFGYNNSSAPLMLESKLVFGKARKIGCLVSIGTGTPPKPDLGNEKRPFKAMFKLFDAAIAIATSSDRAHDDITGLINGGFLPKDAYYRFNVDISALEPLNEVVHGLAEGRNNSKVEKVVKLDKWKMMGFLEQQTSEYLKKGDVVERLRACAMKLVHVENP